MEGGGGLTDQIINLTILWREQLGVSQCSVLHLQDLQETLGIDVEIFPMVTLVSLKLSMCLHCEHFLQLRTFHKPAQFFRESSEVVASRVDQPNMVGVQSDQLYLELAGHFRRCHP